ncbi:MAG: Uma2 family endonuclease [Candidatus Poribacteria bacterium]
MTQEVNIEQLSAFANPLPPGEKMSYEEFLDWLDEDTYAEWVSGVVVFMSPISIEHQNVALFLLTLVSFFVEAHQSGVVCYKPFQMKTGTDLPGRSPDIMFVANDNLSRLKNTHLEGRPKGVGFGVN